MLMKYLSYPLSIFGKVLDHFAEAPSNIPASIHTAQPAVCSVIMPSAQLLNISQSTSEELGVYQNIVRAWVLRMLIPLGGHSDFIGGNGFRNHGIANLLNLTDSNENDDNGESLDIELALQRALQIDQDEPITVFKPGKNAGNKFCRDTALSQLNDLYLVSENQIGKIVLPEPLAENLNQLATLLGLSPVEYWILAFTILMTTHQELIDAYELRGSKSNKHQFRNYLSIVLGISKSDIRCALGTQSVLRQTSLVKLDNYSWELTTLSSEFAERLTLERGMPLDWLRDMITPSAPPQLSLNDYPHLKNSLDALLLYLERSLVDGRKGVNVLIHGVPGTGKTQLTRVLAAKLAYPLYEVAMVDNEGDPRSGESRLRVCLAAQVIFQRQPFLMLLDEAEDVFKNHDSYGGAAQTHKAWTNWLLLIRPHEVLSGIFYWLVLEKAFYPVR